MTAILSKRSYGSSRLKIVVDGDPADGAGLAAKEQTIAEWVDGGVRKLFLKQGPLDTDWVQFSGEADGGLEFKNVIYADSAAPAGGDGSSAAPFNSLQDAIDAAQALYAPFDRKMILVAPNSAFDEDAIVRGGIMHIMGLGPWTLGDAAGAAFASTVPRNLTVDYTYPQTDGKWETFVLGTLMDEEVSSTHTAYNNGVDISGDLLVTNTGGNGGSKNLQLRNVKVRGNYDATAVDPNAVQTYLRRCFFDNAFNSPSAILNVVESCEFDGLLTALQYSKISFCEITGGIAMGGGPVASIPPIGFFNCQITGDFTSPGDFHLDAVSNYYFNLGGGAVAGGAAKVLLHDLV